MPCSLIALLFKALLKRRKEKNILPTGCNTNDRCDAYCIVVLGILRLPANTVLLNTCEPQVFNNTVYLYYLMILLQQPVSWCLLMSQFIPQTLLDALTLFIKTGETVIRGQTIANLKTVLRKYILSDRSTYNFSAEDLHGAGFDYCLSQVSLESFLKADPVALLAKSCQAAREAGTLHAVVERTTYRPALNKFLKWLQQASWYDEAAGVTSGNYAPRNRFGVNIMVANRGRRDLKDEPYGLKETELTPKVRRQLEALQDFCTAAYVPHRQDKKMREITFENHKGRVLDFLGWLQLIEGRQAKSLDLKLLENIKLLSKFLVWGTKKRNNTCGWAQGFCDSAINVAKWRHCSESKRPMYRDIPVIEEIRQINTTLGQGYKEQRKTNKRRKKKEKYMTLEQCIEVVKYLRKCCAPRDSFGQKRSDLSVARSWQRYLLVAILTYCPVRQRELRELELGRTLERLADGYRVMLEPEDNKTADERDFILSDILAADVVVDIDEWLEVWRPKIEAATTDLDHWLGFVERRAFKDTKELTAHLAKLQAQIQCAEQAHQKDEVEQLEKRLKAAQALAETLAQARANFPNNLFFVSFGNSQMEGYGKPLGPTDLYSTVRRAVYTATAALKGLEHPLFKDLDPRKTNPHFFRNIATTHERRHGNPAHRKAFHKVLGNSEAVGDEDYNEMHPGEKTQDAKGWWQSVTLQGKPALIVLYFHNFGRVLSPTSAP